MKHYVLQKDEVTLFHGQASIQSEKGKKTKELDCEIILTNLNFVFTTTIKSLFKKEFETEIFELSAVKIYKDSPYILCDNNIVEIYFEGCEKFIVFENKKEAKEFTNQALKATSGNSKFVRIIKKVQQQIAETNEALNIDIMGAVKTTANVATTVALNAGEMPGAGKKLKKLGFVSNLIAKKKDNDTPLISSANNKLEKVKELKLLLDEGTITEEEFQQLKQEYLKEDLK